MIKPDKGWPFAIKSCWISTKVNNIGIHKAKEILPKPKLDGFEYIFMADSKNFISNCFSVMVMKSPSPANSCQLKVFSTNSENSFERNGRYMDFSLWNVTFTKFQAKLYEY